MMLTKNATHPPRKQQHVMLGFEKKLPPCPICRVNFVTSRFSPYCDRFCKEINRIREENPEQAKEIARLLVNVAARSKRKLTAKGK